MRCTVSSVLMVICEYFFFVFFFEEEQLLMFNPRRLCTYRDDAWNDNFLRKYRAFTDELYPWGMTRRDYYLRIND